jgi:hypothetical protein
MTYLPRAFWPPGVACRSKSVNVWRIGVNCEFQTGGIRKSREETTNTGNFHERKQLESNTRDREKYWISNAWMETRIWTMVHNEYSRRSWVLDDNARARVLETLFSFGKHFRNVIRTICFDRLPPIHRESNDQHGRRPEETCRLSEWCWELWWKHNHERLKMEKEFCK